MVERMEAPPAWLADVQSTACHVLANRTVELSAVASSVMQSHGRRHYKAGHLYKMINLQPKDDHATRPPTGIPRIADQE